MENSHPKKPQNNRPKKLTEFETYAGFLALSRDERNKAFGFHTEQDFSKKYNVSQWTLVEWKKRDDFWKIRDKMLMPYKKYTADVLKALYINCINNGRALDVMAWMNLVEGWAKNRSIEDKPQIKVIIKKISG